MKKRILTMLLALLLLPGLASCGPEQAEEAPALAVYYVSAAGYSEGGRFIEPVSVPVDSGDDLVHLSLRSLQEEPEQPELSSAFIKGTRIYSYTLENGVISVDLSAAYIGLSELEQTAVKACLTLTLCGLEEIRTVDIRIDGSPVAEGLEPSMMLVDNTDSSALEKRLLLYYPDASGHYLSPEYRMLTVGRDRLLAEYVLEELLESDEQRESPLPAGTRLLGVEQKNGVCTVNFSREFADHRSQTAEGQRLCVYAVVNSLTRLDEVDRVRFRVEGNDTGSYEYIDLSASFVAFPGLVRDQDALYQTGAVLYMGLRGSDSVVAVPVFVPLDTSVSREESLVNYILMLTGVSGYTRLVPLAVTLYSAETVNRVCTLDLSEAMFSSGSGSNARRAALALASSLLDTGRIDEVNILVEGEPFMENIRERIEHIVN